MVTINDRISRNTNGTEKIKKKELWMEEKNMLLLCMCGWLLYNGITDHMTERRCPNNNANKYVNTFVFNVGKFAFNINESFSFKIFPFSFAFCH